MTIDTGARDGQAVTAMPPGAALLVLELWQQESL